MVSLSQILGLPQVDDIDTTLPPSVEAAAQARMDRGGPPPGQDIGVSDVINPRQKTSIGRQIWAAMAAGGGASPADVARIRDPDAAQRAAALRVNQAKKLFPGDPMAQMLWVQGDDDFRKTLGKRYDDQIVAEGSAISRNGKEVFRNKQRVVGEKDGYGYVGDDETGLKWGDQRGPTHAENETRRSHQADEAVAQQRADQDGQKIDADADNDDAKSTVQRILRRAAAGEPLSPAEQQIMDAEIQRMKKGDGFGFGLSGAEAQGATRDAIYAPGPSDAVGGAVDPRGIGAGIRKPMKRPAAAPAPAADASNGAQAQLLASVPDGGTFMAPAYKGGPKVAWKKVNGIPQRVK